MSRLQICVVIFIYFEVIIEECESKSSFEDRNEAHKLDLRLKMMYTMILKNFLDATLRTFYI